MNVVFPIKQLGSRQGRGGKDIFFTAYSFCRDSVIPIEEETMYKNVISLRKSNIFGGEVNLEFILLIKL